MRASGRRGNRGGKNNPKVKWFSYRCKRGDLGGMELGFSVEDTMGLRCVFDVGYLAADSKQVLGAKSFVWLNRSLSAEAVFVAAKL